MRRRSFAPASIFTLAERGMAGAGDSVAVNLAAALAVGATVGEAIKPASAATWKRHEPRSAWHYLVPAP